MIGLVRVSLKAEGPFRSCTSMVVILPAGVHNKVAVESGTDRREISEDMEDSIGRVSKLDR